MSTGPGGTSCLRQRKLLATSDVDVGGRGMAAKVALASASSTGAVRWSSPWFETAVVVGAAADGSALGDGGGFLGTGGGTGGRRGRGRTGGDLSGAGSSKADGSRGNAGRKQLAQAVAVAVAGVVAAAAAKVGEKHPGLQARLCTDGARVLGFVEGACQGYRTDVLHQTEQEGVPGRRDRDRCLLGARVPQHVGEHPWAPCFERASQEEGRFYLETELFKLGTLKFLLGRVITVWSRMRVWWHTRRLSSGQPEFLPL